jgi:hypothetical protein
MDDSESRKREHVAAQIERCLPSNDVSVMLFGYYGRPCPRAQGQYADRVVAKLPPSGDYKSGKMLHEGIAVISGLTLVM